MKGKIHKNKSTGIVKRILLSILLVTAGMVIYYHKDTGKRPFYVDSESCKSCHELHYEAWKNKTLHPYQFRPVNNNTDIIKGDFTSSNPVLTFKKEDVEYVVGNKWEQVYARMIDGEYYPFTAKWYVIKKKWVPYKVKNWKDTPMSKKCNGCHTTGFNPDNSQFNEFGIGCEACHGPGSLHTINEEKNSNFLCRICHRKKRDYVKYIINSSNSSVCGQCHNRGNNIPEGKSKTKDIKFNFPVNFSPGDDLNKYFKQLSIKKDTKKKFWWGNGLSKNRHQEFADWRLSKHSQSLKFLKEKYTADRGKLTDGCLKCHSTDYRFSKPGNRPDLSSSKYGVTCISCHEPHGLDKGRLFQKDGSFQCAGCHLDSFIKTIARQGKNHDLHSPGTVSCADCHMPYTVKTGGGFTIRSHAFKIIHPKDTKKYNIPNSCQNGLCHMKESIEWAINNFNDSYPSSGKS